MKQLYLAFSFLLINLGLEAQSYSQYFDGADTSYYNSVFYELDSTGIWHIGQPSKTRFSFAPTFPKALITDTLNSYPSNTTASMHFKVPMDFPFGILAVQWVQSLDFEDSVDGGIIEFRYTDTSAWQNMFNNNYVYNIFGYDSTNVKTLSNGQVGFTGTDTLSNIWLCIDMSWLWFSGAATDSFLDIRFTMISDSIDSQQEGWMIDNFNAHITGIHTINEVEQDRFISVTPNPTKGKLYLNAIKTGSLQYIESIQLMDLSGKMVQEWGAAPTKFEIDIQGHDSGVYILRVNSNLKKEEFRIFLEP